MSTIAPLTIPVAHIDDVDAINALLNALRGLHGPAYEFAVGRWAGEIRVVAPLGRVLYRFFIETTNARVALQTGDHVRGASPDGPYRLVDEALAEVTEDCQETLWPGDVVTATTAPVTLTGSGTYFDVLVEETDYNAPRAAFLRYLGDHPGGCAAYPGAFRREALPPQRPAPDAPDRRGVNRVNEHTLDMRIDRHPTPIRHYHGPVALGNGAVVNHSETAIVLPRTLYGLPEVAQEDAGHVLLYNRPAEDPSDTILIPVRPGSIVVTPAIPANTLGHCFENCFAMLIAIPGFVAPYHMIEE